MICSRLLESPLPDLINYDAQFLVKRNLTKRTWDITAIFNGDKSVHPSRLEKMGLQNQFEVVESLQTLIEQMFGEEDLW